MGHALVLATSSGALKACQGVFCSCCADQLEAAHWTLVVTSWHHDGTGSESGLLAAHAGSWRMSWPGATGMLPLQRWPCCRRVICLHSQQEQSACISPGSLSLAAAALPCNLDTHGLPDNLLTF